MRLSVRFFSIVALVFFVSCGGDSSSGFSVAGNDGNDEVPEGFEGNETTPIEEVTPEDEGADTIGLGDTLSFSFVAEIEDGFLNGNSALGDISVGDLISGTFEYTIILDQNPSVSLGEYTQNTSISVEIGSATIDHISDTVFIRARNNERGVDLFDFRTDGPSVNFSGGLGFLLSDSSQEVFNDDSLPVLFEITEFDDPSFSIFGRLGPDENRIDLGARVISITRN